MDIREGIPASPEPFSNFSNFFETDCSAGEYKVSNVWDSAISSGGAMVEKKLSRIMKTDLSKGTEEFRDALLRRCLFVLGADDVVELADDELDMLAAAGDPSQFLRPDNPENDLL